MTSRISAIPPSAGTKEAIRQGSPRSGNGSGNNSNRKRKKRGFALPFSQAWLKLTGVCLVINVGLMATIFWFHSSWMPRSSSMVLKAHARNRKELWSLLRKRHQSHGAVAEEGGSSDQQQFGGHNNNNAGGDINGDDTSSQDKAAAAADAEAAAMVAAAKAAKEAETEEETDAETEAKKAAAESAETEAAKAQPVAAIPASTIEEQELPFTLGNSPNKDDYDLGQQQYHIIFSTGCSVKQHWQSYQLYYSMVTSQQQGQVTRIASGCTDEEATELAQIHEEQILPMGLIGQKEESVGKSRFHLHTTPEFGEGFHYNNKPYGVAHWMENVLGYGEEKTSTDHDDTILFLLDPDMAMMRPFVNDFTHNEMWVPRTSYPMVDRIKHGFPMASEYGYGNQWFHKTNITKMLNGGHSPIVDLTTADIDENYHAGPPYVATAQDFYKIVTRWRFLAQPTHEQYPFLLSGMYRNCFCIFCKRSPPSQLTLHLSFYPTTEMFAYSLAAADLKLPHQLARSFMVSDWREPGLDLVTKNDKIESSQMCRNVPTEFKPHVLHYCQRLALGKYIMSKHRYPEDFVGQPASCGKPLLAEPPDDVAVKYDYFVDIASGKRHDIRDAKNGKFTQQEKVNQAAFLLCEEIQAFNRGATYFKEHHCPAEEVNMEKSFLFFDSTELTEQEKKQEGVVV